MRKLVGCILVGAFLLKMDVVFDNGRYAGGLVAMMQNIAHAAREWGARFGGGSTDR